MKSGLLARWSGALAASVLAAVLGGCATLGKTDKEIVADRAQARWDLLVKNDFTAAYQYISPGGRQLATADSYVSSLRKNFWTGAQVDKVNCQTSEACEVDVWIEYQHQGIKMRSPVREKWIKTKSDWWFVLER